MVKNSLTEISRCRDAIDSAVARRAGFARALDRHFVRVVRDLGGWTRWREGVA